MSPSIAVAVTVKVAVFVFVSVSTRVLVFTAVGTIVLDGCTLVFTLVTEGTRVDVARGLVLVLLGASVAVSTRSLVDCLVSVVVTTGSLVDCFVADFTGSRVFVGAADVGEGATTVTIGSSVALGGGAGDTLTL